MSKTPNLRSAIEEVENAPIVRLMDSEKEEPVATLKATERLSYILGPSDNANIQVGKEKPYVSGEHAVIYFDADQGWMIRDTSTNGTYLNAGVFAPGGHYVFLYEGEALDPVGPAHGTKFEDGKKFSKRLRQNW